MSEDLPRRGQPRDASSATAASVCTTGRTTCARTQRLVGELRSGSAATRILAGHGALARPGQHDASVRHAGFGTDPRTSVLDPFCRTHDVENLFVVDASFFPSSAAVNPGLTIVAQALRVADHIKGLDLS